MVAYLEVIHASIKSKDGEQPRRVQNLIFAVVPLDVSALL
jgi:hypothetical protein